MSRTLLASLLCIVLVGCGEDPVIDAGECINRLTEEERQQGWRLLFDGASLAQWRSYREDQVNSGWGVENGCLTRLKPDGKARLSVKKF